MLPIREPLHQPNPLSKRYLEVAVRRGSTRFVLRAQSTARQRGNRRPGNGHLRRLRCSCRSLDWFVVLHVHERFETNQNIRHIGWVMLNCSNSQMASNGSVVHTHLVRSAWKTQWKTVINDSIYFVSSSFLLQSLNHVLMIGIARPPFLLLYRPSFLPLNLISPSISRPSRLTSRGGVIKGEVSAIRSYSGRSGPGTAFRFNSGVVNA